MDDALLAGLRSAGAMIGESNLPSWEELLAKVGSDSELRWAIARTKREIGAGQVTATQVSKTMRHTLKCHEPERKKGELLVDRAAVAERRPSAPIPKSTPCAQVTPTVDESAPIAAEVVQPAEHEPTPAQSPQPATERNRASAPTKEATVPKQINTADLREIAKQLGTFKVADLAKKAKCSPPTARKAIEEMEAEGFLVREEAGNRRSPFVVAGRGAAKPGTAPGGSVKPVAARRSPEPRPPKHVGFSHSDLVLDDRFDVLLGRLVDAYAEKHDLGPKPSARRALLEAAAAVFPTEA